VGIRKVRRAIPCGCGCGIDVITPDAKCRERRFLPGHQSRTINPGLAIMQSLPKPAVGQYWRATGDHWRTSRARARSVVDTTSCEWAHIGGCKGKIDAAHLDGDFTNGDRSNIKSLCRSHHSLLDNGRIDPTKPVMPDFYVDGGGKRRYKKAK
jgi:hypothetical protein